jgi:hypothetical protein
MEEPVEETITIAEFIHLIRALPADELCVRPGVWYTTQKQHS